MLASASTSATLRFNEVRILLNDITSREVPPPSADVDTVMILRGLFYVHLYGAFEYSINNAVQLYLQSISSANVPYLHLEQMFYSVALDGRFMSILDRKASGKWDGRRALLVQQRSNDLCGLSDTLFSYDLQNIWYKTLVELFQSLGIDRHVLPNVRYRGYIDEVVEKRNAIAHGRESPLSVGTVRSADLEKRYDAISTTAAYLIGCLASHLNGREFIDPAHRAAYISANP